MFNKLWRVATFSVMLVAPVIAAHAELITNGGFEAGGGSLAGWTVTDQTGGSGSWYLQSGTVSPLNGFPVAAPPEATHAAMTDQGGPGSHALTQSFTIPVDPIASATISFQLFINNQASVFFSPNSLDFNVTPNQQIRVDILTATADVFSVTLLGCISTGRRLDQAGHHQ